MKKKGFTLIELLAVIVILAVVALISVPIVTQTITVFRKDAYKNQIRYICDSASYYEFDHLDDLPQTPGEKASITLGVLKAGKYVKPAIQNPMTGKYFSDELVIELTRNAEAYDCKVIEDSAEETESDSYDFTKPTLVLKGSSTLQLDFAAEYEEPGFIARNSSGEDISDTVVVTGTINNHDLDHPSVLTYTVGEVSVQRTIEIVDRVKPVITVEGHSSSTEQEFSVNAEAGVYQIPSATVTDNTGEEIEATTSGTVTGTIPGTYTVIYIAVDHSENEATLTMHVTISDNQGPVITILGNPTEYTNENVLIAVNAVDEGSGLPASPYSFDGGTTWTSGNTKLVGENGSFEVWVKDNANNISKETVTVNKIDKTLPDMSFAVASGTSGTNYWYTTNVGVTLTPSAGSSGVREYYYCSTTSSTCTPDTRVSGSTPTTVTLSNETDTNKICVTIDSASGTTNTKCSDNYKIDKHAPVITVEGHTSNFSESILAGSSYTVTAGTATDNLTSNVQVTSRGNVTPLIAGTYNITYTATDDAGNTTTLVKTVEVVQLRAEDLIYTNSTYTSCEDVKCALDELYTKFK